ncbi:hypothetical protein SNEBB_010011 [Seison nebaliae]|nr:hypothetical protein SNEBB_010011 [Seison nebaliae]
MSLYDDDNEMIADKCELMNSTKVEKDIKNESPKTFQLNSERLNLMSKQIQIRSSLQKNRKSLGPEPIKRHFVPPPKSTNMHKKLITTTTTVTFNEKLEKKNKNDELNETNNLTDIFNNDEDDEQFLKKFPKKNTTNAESTFGQLKTSSIIPKQGRADADLSKMKEDEFENDFNDTFMNPAIQKKNYRCTFGIDEYDPMFPNSYEFLSFERRRHMIAGEFRLRVKIKELQMKLEEAKNEVTQLPTSEQKGRSQLKKLPRRRKYSNDSDKSSESSIKSSPKHKRNGKDSYRKSKGSGQQVAKKLMEKMGYVDGLGLGRDNKGITQSLQVKKKRSNIGVVINPDKRKSKNTNIQPNKQPVLQSAMSRYVDEKDD